jgi:N-acetylglucosaminyl-diphospho-decaprenol L-rhamnosyltransferase
MSGLSIVIVNYRSGELLLGCLQSLAEHVTYLGLEIWIINNDSTSDLTPVFARPWPEIHFIQNDFNRGFAAAANLGFQHSRGDLVLLLNPDVLAQPGSIETLIQTLRENPDCGVVLPQLKNPDGTLQYSCRHFYTFTTLIMRRAPFKQWFPDHRSVRRHLMADWDHGHLAEVDWGLGAAMMVRRTAVDGDLLFDERFFLYFEDVDLCLRMWQRGWRVLYQPKASMVHHHRRDSAKELTHPAKKRHFLSLMKFLWKHGGGLGKRPPMPGKKRPNEMGKEILSP